jgi:hypothetical protein
LMLILFMFADLQTQATFECSLFEFRTRFEKSEQIRARR